MWPGDLVFDPTWLSFEPDLEIIKKNIFSKIHNDCFKNVTAKVLTRFVVLRPSQPNGVMSSAVSLPNHTFTGQA